MFQSFDPRNKIVIKKIYLKKKICYLSKVSRAKIIYAIIYCFSKKKKNE